MRAQTAGTSDGNLEAVIRMMLPVRLLGGKGFPCSPGQRQDRGDLP